jgi:hypothetical protein
MPKPNLTLLLVAVPALALPGAAMAQPDDSVPANCWGVVTSQFARADRGIGEHSSNQTNPRLGLGNVAKALYDQGLISDPHVSDLGALLAQLDEFDETVCPVQQP